MQEKEIVIKLDEEIYADILNNKRYTDKTILALIKGIRNGTVLEPHGPLIDVNNIQEIELEDSLTVLTHKKGDEIDWHIDALIVLEATKGDVE